MIHETDFDFAARRPAPKLDFSIVEPGKSYKAEQGVDYRSLPAFRTALVRYAIQHRMRYRTRAVGRVVYFKLEPYN